MTPVSDLCARLLTVLECEEKLYLELRSVLQRERELVAALDAKGLDEMALRKEALADEGRLLESSRLPIAAALARELGQDDARPALSLLFAQLGPEADALRERHARLVALIGAVRELLEANAFFAHEAREQVRGTLRLLGRLLPSPQTYGAQGVPEMDPGTGRLVRRTA